MRDVGPDPVDAAAPELDVGASEGGDASAGGVVPRDAGMDDERVPVFLAQEFYRSEDGRLWETLAADRFAGSHPIRFIEPGWVAPAACE